MGAVTTAIDKTSQKVGAICAGPQNCAGASTKTIKITLPASYDAGGSALNLSSYFTSRVYWAVPLTPFCINASTGAVYIGLVPGTAKTDTPGGYSPTDWKVRSAATATESSAAANLSAYTGYILVCGE